MLITIMLLAFTTVSFGDCTNADEYRFVDGSTVSVETTDNWNVNSEDDLVRWDDMWNLCPDKTSELSNNDKQTND